MFSVSVFVFLILGTNQRNTKANERTNVRTAKEKPEFLVSVFNVTKDKSERRRNRKDKRLFMLEARTQEIQTDQRLLKVRKQF